MNLSMCRIKKILSLFFLFNLYAQVTFANQCLPPPQLVSSFNGVYEGTMNLRDETVRQIPLAVSLVLTGEDEIINVPGGSVEVRKVIDGAFMVDEEGGPYPFIKVTFDMSDGRLDMRYNRLRQDPTAHAPSSFRLMGFMQRPGEIEGQVSSGNRGIIGTFKINKVNKPFLVPKVKYNGTWSGLVKYSDGRTAPGKVTIEPTSYMSSNPPDYELEYSRGYVGNFAVDGAQFAFVEVAVDYLRRRMILNHKQPQFNTVLSLLSQFDPTLKKMTSRLHSSLMGPTAEFILTKENTRD